MRWVGAGDPIFMAIRDTEMAIFRKLQSQRISLVAIRQHLRLRHNAYEMKNAARRRPIRRDRVVLSLCGYGSSSRRAWRLMHEYGC